MMNERIKALMLKAGGVLAPAYVTDADGNSIWTDNAKVDTIDMDGEYFAKLLVRECLSIADQEHKLALEFDWDNDDTALGIKDSIKQHFGVE